MVDTTLLETMKPFMNEATKLAKTEAPPVIPDYLYMQRYEVVNASARGAKSSMPSTPPPSPPACAPRRRRPPPCRTSAPTT